MGSASRSPSSRTRRRNLGGQQIYYCVTIVFIWCGVCADFSESICFRPLHFGAVKLCDHGSRLHQMPSAEFCADIGTVFLCQQDKNKKDNVGPRPSSERVRVLQESNHHGIHAFHFVLADFRISTTSLLPHRVHSRQTSTIRAKTFPNQPPPHGFQQRKSDTLRGADPRHL